MSAEFEGVHLTRPSSGSNLPLRELGMSAEFEGVHLTRPSSGSNLPLRELGMSAEFEGVHLTRPSSGNNLPDEALALPLALRFAFAAAPLVVSPTILLINVAIIITCFMIILT